MGLPSVDLTKYILGQNPGSPGVSSAGKTSELSELGNLNFQLGVVVDIILDDTHPYFQKNPNDPNYSTKTTVNPRQIPPNYKNDIPATEDIDFSYIGRVKIRLVESEKNTPISTLPWAIPLDNTITQYPLLNEMVLVTKIYGNYFYFKPLNRFNFLGVNSDFGREQSLNLNYESAKPSKPDPKRKSYLSYPKFKPSPRVGYLGEYFIINPFIRSIKKNEGDTVIESRFGQSIRFTAYNNDRELDNKSPHSSYKLDNNLYVDSSNGGYGNPRIIIRNRQRNIAQNTPQKGLHSKLPQIETITDKEKNYGGQIEEDINNDGSTIEINSGFVISKWKTTVYKSIFGVTNGSDPTEEQKRFNPPNSTKFTLPPWNGDQIIINTDRLILSSRLGESLHFSKRRYSVVTDNEYTVDANDQIVLTTNRLTCINSPQIFLGQYGETNEPALLGQTTVDWLYDLCNWLLDHVHWYHHVHPHPHVHHDVSLSDDGGGPSIGKINTQDAIPNQTQIPVQQIKLKLLRDNLHKSLSRRVFLTGGGYAPGSDGVKPAGSGGDCKEPVVINNVTGTGVVGDFKGRNRREGPVETVFVRKGT